MSLFSATCWKMKCFLILLLLRSPIYTNGEIHYDGSREIAKNSYGRHMEVLHKIFLANTTKPDLSKKFFPQWNKNYNGMMFWGSRIKKGPDDAFTKIVEMPTSASPKLALYNKYAKVGTDGRSNAKITSRTTNLTLSDVFNRGIVIGADMKIETEQPSPKNVFARNMPKIIIITSVIKVIMPENKKDAVHDFLPNRRAMQPAVEESTLPSIDYPKYQGNFKKIFKAQTPRSEDADEKVDDTERRLLKIEESVPILQLRDMENVVAKEQHREIADINNMRMELLRDRALFENMKRDWLRQMGHPLTIKPVNLIETPTTETTIKKPTTRLPEFVTYVRRFDWTFKDKKQNWPENFWPREETTKKMAIQYLNDDENVFPEFIKDKTYFKSKHALGRIKFCNYNCDTNFEPACVGLGHLRVVVGNKCEFDVLQCSTEQEWVPVWDASCKAPWREFMQLLFMDI